LRASEDCGFQPFAHRVSDIHSLSLTAFARAELPLTSLCHAHAPAARSLSLTAFARAELPLASLCRAPMLQTSTSLAASQLASIASALAPQLFESPAFTFFSPHRLAHASSPLPDLPARTRAARPTGPCDHHCASDLTTDFASMATLPLLSFRGLRKSRDPFSPTAVLPDDQRPILS
jgi:hypothetical protein